MMSGMVRYLGQVFREFSFIRWVPFVRALGLTVYVIIVSIIFGFLLGALDNGFATLLKGVIL